MFEFLLLTSLALIVISQELPTEKQNNQKSLPAKNKSISKPIKTEHPAHANPDKKKQPRRSLFVRAA